MTLAMARPVNGLVAKGVPTVFGPSSQPLKNLISSLSLSESLCRSCIAI